MELSRVNGVVNGHISYPGLVGFGFASGIEISGVAAEDFSMRDRPFSGMN